MSVPPRYSDAQGQCVTVTLHSPSGLPLRTRTPIAESVALRDFRYTKGRYYGTP